MDMRAYEWIYETDVVIDNENIALQYDVILAVQLWDRRSKNLSDLGV